MKHNIIITEEAAEQVKRLIKQHIIKLQTAKCTAICVYTPLERKLGEQNENTDKAIIPPFICEWKSPLQQLDQSKATHIGKFS